MQKTVLELVDKRARAPFKDIDRAGAVQRIGRAGAIGARGCRSSFPAARAARTIGPLQASLTHPAEKAALGAADPAAGRKHEIEDAAPEWKPPLHLVFTPIYGSRHPLTRRKGFPAPL